MKKSKNKTKIFFTYQNNFFIFLIISFLLLTIGYASINNISFNISGLANVEKSVQIYISNVTTLSNVDATSIPSEPSKTFFSSEITLSDTNKLSQVVYKITIYNGSVADIVLDEIYNEEILELGLNDNQDIITEFSNSDGDFIDVSAKDFIIESGKSKDITVTVKYREDLENIVSNSFNLGVNFKFKAITYISYVGFENYTDFENTPGYDTKLIEGEELSITLPNDISFITLNRNQQMLIIGRDFTFNNSVLNYRASSGGNLEISALNNHPIRDRFNLDGIVLNQPFVLTGNDTYTYNADLNTIYFEADLSLITTLNSKDNIISIGTEMDIFTPTQQGGINLHLFYPDGSGKMIISPIMKKVTETQSSHMQFLVNMNNQNSKIAKFAFNSNGLYFNGNMLLSAEGINNSMVSIYDNQGRYTDSVYLSSFFTQFSNNLEIKIGSTEGDNRSNAKYNDFVVFNKKLTSEEMIRITSITEPEAPPEIIRTGFGRTNLLTTPNYNSNGAPFTLYTGNFNAISKTLIVEMNVDDCSSTTEFENILSFGKQISGWVPTTARDVHLHFYYTKSNRTLTIAPLINAVTARQFEIAFGPDELPNGKMKIGFSINGVYLNGKKLFDDKAFGENVTTKVSPGRPAAPPGYQTDYLSRFFEPWLAGDYYIDIGSTQGAARSDATYTQFEICNISMTEAELIHYTTVGNE